MVDDSSTDPWGVWGPLSLGSQGSACDDSEQLGRRRGSASYWTVAVLFQFPQSLSNCTKYRKEKNIDKCFYSFVLVLVHKKNLKAKGRRQKWTNLIKTFLKIPVFVVWLCGRYFSRPARGLKKSTVAFRCVQVSLRYLPEHQHMVCSRHGGWCTNGFLNHLEQTKAKRTSTVSLTGWSQRDLLAQKYRGKRLG